MPPSLPASRLGKSERLKDPARISAVGVFDPDGCMLLGRRQDDGLYANPGGHAEPGESAADAAARELWEEAGIRAPLRWVGRERSGDYLVDCFRADLPERPDATSANDPDEEVLTWEWATVVDGVLPEPFVSELHVPTQRNVLLRVLGIHPAGALTKAEEPARDILVCIPKSRLGQVEEEERQVAAQVASGHKPPTYYWTLHRLPRSPVRRVYFAWDGAVRAYHDAVGTLDRPDPRVVMDHRIHAVEPVPTRSFRGWRYFTVGANSPQSENGARMKKGEAPDSNIEILIEQDEVARLLQHPDPRERTLALKGAGVRRHHLEAALRSGDVALEQAVLAHPGLDAVLVGRLFQEPGRWDVKARLAGRDDLQGHHLGALLRTAVESGEPGAAACADQLLRDPRTPRDALQHAWDVGFCCPLVLRHPSCPPDVLTSVASTAVRSRCLDPDGAAALRHPALQPDVLAAAVRSRCPDLVAAASANPDLPADLVAEVLATASLPLPPQDLLARSRYAEARGLALSGWNVLPEHLEQAARDPDPHVSSAIRDSQIAKSEGSPGVIIRAIDLGIPPHAGYDDFSHRARAAAAQVDVLQPLVLDDLDGERPGVLYRLDPAGDPWPTLAAQAAWCAALPRCVVPTVLARDRSGRDVLVRRLERGWQPVAELAQVSALGWRVPLDARLLRLEAARIGVLDWLLGFRGRHGWSLFLDPAGCRWMAEVSLAGCDGKRDFSQEDPGPLDYVSGDHTCVRDVGVAELLPQAVAWLEGVGPAVLAALLRYLPRVGPKSIEGVRGRLAALPRSWRAATRSAG